MTATIATIIYGVYKQNEEKNLRRFYFPFNEKPTRIEPPRKKPITLTYSIEQDPVNYRKTVRKLNDPDKILDKGL